MTLHVAGRPDPLPPSAEALLDALPGPSLLCLPGRDRTRARVVSGSLHGNEPSGARAIHAWLASGAAPAVDTWLFLGGVEAARTPPRWSRRFLPGRRDPNRCFRPPFDGPDGAIAEEVLARLRALPLEAVVDLHNNTGRNPAYGIAHVRDAAHFGLVALFAPRCVYSEILLGTFPEPFAGVAPAVTIECGTAGTLEADAVAFAGLQRFLAAEALAPLLPGQPMDVFIQPARVRLRAGLRLAIADAPDPEADFTLDLALEASNFDTVDVGTRIGWVRGDTWPVEATDEQGREVSRDYFTLEGGLLVARRAFWPAMVTSQVEAALVDCLFYAADRG